MQRFQRRRGHEQQPLVASSLKTESLLDDKEEDSAKMEHIPQEKLSQFWLRNARGIDCMVHWWNPTLDSTSARPRGVVVLFHGLGGHAMYPTVRYLAELLVQNNFCVCCGDYSGHGQSRGRRGFIESTEVLLEDSKQIVEFARQQDQHLSLYLGGVSMGGAVALLLSIQFKESISGLILLAPMVSLDLPKWKRSILRNLHRISNTMGLFKPSPKYADHQFRDASRREEAENDQFCYRGPLLISSALACVELCSRTQQHLKEISTPFLALMALDDCFVDNNGIDELMDEASSVDKTLKEYNALHGLLCEEERLRSHIEEDIVEWLVQRTDGIHTL